MASSTSATGRSRQEDGLSIGAVLERLRSEFPEVTISKIRFLEAEGLVCPARSAAGYRQFTDADVQRLRFVLAAQRDHYLPLKVIREQLAAADRGLPAAAPQPRSARASAPESGRPVPFDFVTVPGVRIDRAELAERAGVDADLVAELEQIGLLCADADGRYPPDAVRVASTARAMAGFGLHPRQLRAFRGSADHEVGLVNQALAPLLRSSDARARELAQEKARELAALSVTLHTLLVKAGLAALPAGRV